jgi:transcriptional regulator with XRE-family HTH domain
VPLAGEHEVEMLPGHTELLRRAANAREASQPIPANNRGHFFPRFFRAPGMFRCHHVGRFLQRSYYVNTFFMKNVGERLEALRRRLTLNWGELAAHLDISRAMLDFMRSGQRVPSPKTMRKIEAAELHAGIESSAIDAATAFDTTMEEHWNRIGEMLDEMTEAGSRIISASKGIKTALEAIRKHRRK